MIAFGKISPGRIGFFQGGSGTFQCTTRASLAIRWVINGTAIVFGGPNPIGSATNSIATAHLVDVSVDESFVGIRVSVLIVTPDPDFTGVINVTCSNGVDERCVATVHIISKYENMLVNLLWETYWRTELT